MCSAPPGPEHRRLARRSGWPCARVAPPKPGRHGYLVPQHPGKRCVRKTVEDTILSNEKSTGGEGHDFNIRFQLCRQSRLPAHRHAATSPVSISLPDHNLSLQAALKAKRAIDWLASAATAGPVHAGAMDKASLCRGWPIAASRSTVCPPRAGPSGLFLASEAYTLPNCNSPGTARAVKPPAGRRSSAPAHRSGP
jgi:hypothetical protein